MTVTSTSPGYPVHVVGVVQPSPAGLTRCSFSPTVLPFAGICVASHMRLSKPTLPPWRLATPLFASSVYVLAVEHEPGGCLATPPTGPMRLPYRPMIAPKYGLLLTYAALV